MEGIRGSCRITVLDREPDNRDTILNQAERGTGDVVLVSRAKGGRLVLER